MRHPPGFAAALLASALVLPLPAATRADLPDRVERAEQARAVLRRHCLRCHGEKGRGGVRLLEQSLTDPGRGLVVPGAPDRSVLMDLVEGGSMPPGALPKVPARDRAVLREWIRTGAAAAFPPETGRDYLLRQLADDFHKVPESSKPYIRYLSLDHLGPDRANRQVAAAVLRAVLRRLSVEGKQPADPVAVEPTGSLLRIDLRETGWDGKPYKGEALNLFDLLLLEYPYGVLPGGKLPAGLTAFLRQTRQVRPILYVRGDWLARVAVREPLYSDLLEVLRKPPDAQPPREALAPLPGETVGLDEAVRELETSPDVPLLQGVLRKIKPLAALGRKETVTRAVWERHYLEVVRRLGNDTPILPLDGLTWPNHTPDPDLKLDIRLIDPAGPGLPSNPPGKDSLRANKDKICAWIHSNRDVVFELILTHPGDNMQFVRKPSPLTNAESPFIISATQKVGAGKRSFTLYAYPKSGLAPEAPYPAGKVLRVDGISDRFLHPFYELAGNGQGFKGPDAAKMVKITVPFTAVP